MTEPASETQPYRMPARDWGDAEPEPVEWPTVIVSSRDDAPVPRVGAAVRLEAAATAAGWSVKQTYALASVPEARYLNGNVRKPAHMLASVAVRLTRRGPARNQWGFAVWHREFQHEEDDNGWRFAHAFIDGELVGARSIAEALR